MVAGLITSGARRAAMPAKYSTKIVCLAKSRKPGGRCIAGKVMEGDAFGGWIRPVSGRPSVEISLEERQFENGQEPEILDILDIPMIEAAPRLHQRENHIIDADSYWTTAGVVTWKEHGRMSDSPPPVSFNQLSTVSVKQNR